MGDDLRTLAAEVFAAHTLGAGLGRPIEPGNPWAQPNAKAFAAMDAVLAAVLPDVADHLTLRADAVPWSDPTLRRGIQYAASVVRTLAATAPPAASTSPQSVQNAPVVPVEAPTAPGPSEAAAAPLDGSPWHAGGTTPQTAGRHIYRAGGETPIGSMDTSELAAQVVAEHEQARHNRAELAGADTGAFIAVPRSQWAAIQRDRARDAHVIDGLAAAADRLAGAQGLADLRGRLAVELIVERDRLAAELAAARAALAAFGAGVDWSKNGATG